MQGSVFSHTKVQRARRFLETLLGFFGERRAWFFMKFHVFHGSVFYPQMAQITQIF